MSELRARIRSAWEGRVSGCQLGKPVEMLSMSQGAPALTRYLETAEALPLRDYVPCLPGTPVAEGVGAASCRERLSRSEPDDDINYTVLALLLLEENGLALQTLDVARAWLKRLPFAAVFTAERAAYRVLVERGNEWFAEGGPLGFELEACSDNPFNDWIGAQIRADLYGWVCPGRPDLAADLASRDARLSHRGDGVHGAAFVAALAAAIPAESALEPAIDAALREIPEHSGAAQAVSLGLAHAEKADGGALLREHYGDMSPVHTLNNLALVVWALVRHGNDFGAAIGEVVSAGLDTDCNGATVGGLWGLQGRPIPEAWTRPWNERVGVSLAGFDELPLGELVERTVAVAERIGFAPLASG